MRIFKSWQVCKMMLLGRLYGNKNTQKISFLPLLNIFFIPVLPLNKYCVTVVPQSYKILQIQIFDEM